MPCNIISKLYVFVDVIEQNRRDFYLPCSGIPVSAECKDLLSKVLVGRPSKRYTVQEIQKHPWYLKDLPPGVIQMNNECLKLRNHSSGFQTDIEIQNIVMQAIGTGTTHVEEDNDDDIIVSPSTCSIAYPYQFGLLDCTVPERFTQKMTSAFECLDACLCQHKLLLSSMDGSERFDHFTKI